MAPASPAVAAAVEWRPAHIETNARGRQLALAGNHAEAMVNFDAAIAACPTYAEACANRAASAIRLDLPDQAYEAYVRAAILTPNFGEALEGVRRLGALTGKSQIIQTPWQVNPQPFVSQSAAGAVIDLPTEDLSETMMRGQLALMPDNPQLVTNLGRLLRHEGRYAEAEMFSRYALALAPWDEEAAFNLCLALDALGRTQEVKRVATDAAAAGARGNRLIPFALWSEMSLGAWSDYDTLRIKAIDLLQAGAADGAPFTTLHLTADPRLQRECAAVFGVSRSAKSVKLIQPPQVTPRARLRIGYISADFRGHAVARLCAELFELHDRSRFEVYGYAIYAMDTTLIATRIRNAFDRMLGLHRTTTAVAAQAIADDNIDILVDLTGYTTHCRPDILAARPAPLQVNYLGYPGTLGSKAIDYILADRVVLPPEQQQWFDEAVVYLPSSYQINDRKRNTGMNHGTRGDHGLPPQGIVFCCFNDTRKITPGMFAVWMRILKRASGTVLWLLAPKDTTRNNLRREAAAASVDPGRLIFAGLLPYEEHLARYSLADLFLDTQPYNAHTTASDALWCGCPVLTVLGESFPGRVAASLLQAAGLPDLAAGSVTEYEDLAVRLAAAPELLVGLRKRLWDNRMTCALFDSQRTTSDLEWAYDEMWRRHEGGLTPASFDVPRRPSRPQP